MVTNIIWAISTLLPAKAFVLTIGSQYPPRHNLHLYQSLTHAQGELLKHRWEKAPDTSRSGFMGRIFCRIFGFSGFSDFRLDVGVMSPGIVQETRAVFPNAGVGVL